MAGYTRQSVADIINGADITAPPVNAEFNQLASAFNGSTGHSHDGSTGNAPKINLTTSVSGYLPAVHGGVGGKNNLAATTNPAATDDAGDGYAPGSLWENTTTGRIFICVGNTANAAVWRELVQVETGNVIKPITHDTIDLGTPAVRFQDLYLSGGISASGNVALGGTLNVTGATTLTGAATANGGLTVNGATTLAGNVTIGDPLSTLDTIAVGAGFTSNLVPSTNAGVSLGTSSTQWNNLYIDGTATIDTLTVDENATVAGTLGVTGTSTLSTANITNITATGTINLAGATVSNLGTVTTAAIGGGSLNNVVIGGSTPAAITGTTITGTSLVGPLTGNVTGNVTGNLTGNVTGNVTGNLTGNVTATSGTSNFTNVTISGQLNMDATSAATITNLTAPSNDLDAATKLYVDTAVSNLVDSAPDSLNTLNELAAAINDDASAYNTLNTAIGNKLPKSGGTMSGAINMGGQKITNAADPTSAQDLATKNYIDTTYVDYSSAGDAATDARKLATNAEDVQYTLADGTTTGYSALHYAAKAAASYDSFDDRYLGSKASDPTLDNDNNALITGALYFDSTNGVMKVYNGTEWANASSSIEGIKSNFYYTATSGQTAFSGSDDNSNTLVIDKAGLVNVYMNGVRLHEDDYTVSAAGDSVTLAAGAATGDLIYLEVFGNFAGQSGADVAITGGSITGLDELEINGTDTEAAGSQLLKVRNSTTGEAVTIGLYSKADNGGDGNSGSITFDAGADGSAANNELRFNADHQTDTNADLVIKGNGNIGLGTASPGYKLDFGTVSNGTTLFNVTNGSNSNLRFKVEDGVSTIMNTGGSGALAFTSGGASERMRLDSSGSLLIGVTSISGASSPQDTSTTAGLGVSLSQYGPLAAAAYQTAPITANRVANEGALLNFKYNGGTVGTIGYQSSDLNIDGPSGHSGIRFQSSSLLPRLNGADAHNSVDVGYPTTFHFRNGYFGGSLFTGNGSAASPAFRFYGDDDTGMFRASSNVLGLSTGGTERLRIDSEGRVAIGTTSTYDNAWGTNSKQLTVNGNQYGLLRLEANGASFTDTRYHIGAGSGKFYGAYDDVNGIHRFVVDENGGIGFNGEENADDYYANNMVLRCSDEGGLTLRSTSTQHAAYIMFADGTSNTGRYRYYLGHDHANDVTYNVSYGEHRFFTANGSDGAKHTATFNQHGLTFNGDSAASNALDDYEEGSFTPTVSSTGWAGVYHSTNRGRYTKIGNIVYFSYNLDLTSTSTQPTGSVVLGGLPFASASTSAEVAAPRFEMSTYNVNYDSTAGHKYQGYIPTTAVTTIQVLDSKDNGTWAVVNHGSGTSQLSLPSGRALIIMNGFYFTDS